MQSKLPKVGTTIFTVMSQLAQEHGAVNLGQGFPDFDADPALIDAVYQAMRGGHNQYPPMIGARPLRLRIAEKIARLYAYHADVDQEITITAGATQALFTAINALVGAGDEVIIFTPCYDSYAPAVALAGGRAVFVPLDADYRLDINALAPLINARTKMIIVNTPHNPTGRIWSAEDWQKLAQILAGTDIFVLSDEVYEHMVFAGARHLSALQYLASRAIVVSSFGKTYHVTGWKIGYVVAAPAISAEFRKVHQFNVFTVNSAMQMGIAQYMSDPQPYEQLANFYERKRDLLCEGLIRAGFAPEPCEGTYFILAKPPAIAAFAGLNDVAIAQLMTTRFGITPIPLSAFVPSPAKPPNQDARAVLRFCFAKTPQTLDQAIEKLMAITD